MLDVAAGAGRHSRFLTDLGHTVTAIDVDASLLAQSGAAEIVCADLEQSGVLLAGRRFDGVIVTNYLHRPLFAQIAAWLGEHGVLIYETFARGQAAFGRPTNPDFLLEPGELLSAFAQLQVVAFEQGIDEGPPQRAVQRLCAVRHSRALPISGFTSP